MFSQHSRAMHAQRKPVLVGLVLLVCALTENFGECAPRGAAAMVPLRLAAIVRHMEGQRSTESTPTSQREPPVTPRDLGSLKSDRGDQIIEIFPRDLRKKEKFIKHLTGPLHFSPKCRKHVYRLYHNTRDCTVPAYFKRCARLLTRLAGSPRCTEG